MICLAALPPALQAAEAERLAREEARRPFDLATVPPVRAALLRLGDREHRLLLTLHHIAADEASLEILARDLGSSYEALSQGRPSPLDPAAAPDGRRGRLAKRAGAGRIAGGAAGLVGGAAGGRAGPGAALGPSPDGAGGSRRPCLRGPPARDLRGPGRSGPAGERDPLHGPAGGVPGVPLPALRRPRLRRGLALLHPWPA